MTYPSNRFCQDVGQRLLVSLDLLLRLTLYLDDGLHVFNVSESSSYDPAVAGLRASRSLSINVKSKYNYHAPFGSLT